MSIRVRHFVVLALALALTAGLSQTARAQMPEEKTVAGISYVAGGIGDSEVAAMQAQASSYSAMIEFVEVEAGSQHGNWTADIAVDIKSGTQLLASINVPGPLLLLRLAPGRYTLEATHGDVKLTKVLEVKTRAAVSRSPVRIRGR